MRLIDADKLNIDFYDEYETEDDAYAYGYISKHQIDTAPTIDAVSVVHGEWKPFDLKWGRSIWYCTACEEGVEVPCDIWTHKPIYNYCPNCGAKMKGADDE